MSNFFLRPSSYFGHLQPPSPPFSWQSPFYQRVRQTDRRVTALCFFIYIYVFSVCLPALSSSLRLILRILRPLILPPAYFFLFLALLDLSPFFGAVSYVESRTLGGGVRATLLYTNRR